VTALDIFCVGEPPEDGRQTGQKHVVWEVHNKIYKKNTLLRTEVIPIFNIFYDITELKIHEERNFPLYTIN
jgi:hypothetical protein